MKKVKRTMQANVGRRREMEKFRGIMKHMSSQMTLSTKKGGRIQRHWMYPESSNRSLIGDMRAHMKQREKNNKGG